MKKFTRLQNRVWQSMLALFMIVVFSSMSFGQIIISQYIETNSGTTPKGIEIWNNSGSSIDFSSDNLVVKKGGNGGTPSTVVTVSSGTFAAGEVWVIGTSDIGTYLTNEGIGTSNYTEKTFSFNGDDALELWISTTKEDVFGNPGSDPGSSWAGNGVDTRNQNIGIKSGITNGDTDGWTDPSLRFEVVTTDNSLTDFGVAPSSGSTPTITTSISSLTNFDYAEGSGPSTSQSFTIEGTNLTADILVTPPTNYEISDNDATFQGTAITLTQSGGDVSTTTLYTRLKTGLSAADYNEDITCTSTGATNKTISLSGSVETPQTTTLPYTETFDADLGQCSTNSVSGATKEWGFNSAAANMNGYNSGDLETDWLILPGINLDNYTSEGMSFTTEYQYGTDDINNYLKLYYSTNYSGVGDPTSSTWTELSYTQPSAATTETSSGNIDLSAISGTSVYIGFKYNYNSGSYRNWTVDNISISEQNTPEPTNHVASFTATAGSTTAITTTWTDNDGAQAAENFLVLANTTGTFTSPVDGTEQSDDTDLSDGAGLVNISTGTETYEWTGLTANTQYYFKIYPYTNSGSSIDFKTDGTVPTTNTTTCSSISDPTATAATDTDHESFTANWNAVTGADNYKLDVYLPNEIIILNESFDNGVSPFPIDWEKNEKVYTSTDGFTGKSIKLGSSGNVGYIITPTVDCSAGSGDFSVNIFAKQYSASENKISIFHAADGTNFNSQLDFDLNDSWSNYIANFTNGTVNSKIKISTFSTSQERAYVDSVNIEQLNYVSGYINKTVAGTSDAVTGLSASTDYKYKVRAYANCGSGTTTNNSNIIDVTTSIDPTTPSITDVAITEAAPYYAGDNITVTWTSANVNFVNIYVYIPANSAWELFSGGVTSDGSEELTIPSDATFNENYKFMVAYVTDTTVNSETSIFEIRGVANDISELRDNHNIGDKVKLTGNVLVSFTQSSPNQKFIQDGSGAVLIDDNAGTITSPYNVGDQMPGLLGTLSEDGNMLQFVPITDPGAATATGQTITPNVVTLSALNSNFDDYEAQLVTVEGVTFTGADGSATFANYTIYELSDGTETFNFRTSFADMDYISSLIASDKMDIIGILTERTDGIFITSRMESEMVDNYGPVPDFGSLDGSTNVHPDNNISIAFGENVYKDASQTAFTVDEEVTAGFKFYTNNAKALVPLAADFTALIDGTDVTIKINSTLPDESNIVLEIQSGVFFDHNGVDASTETVSFETGKLVDATFNVDMSIEFYDNAWDSTATILDISGDYDGYAGTRVYDADKDLIYSTVISNLLVGDDVKFRFRKSGAAEQETNERTYTVIDGTNEFTAFYNDVVPDEKAEFKYFKVTGQASSEQILTDKDSVYITVLFGTDISNLTPNFDVSPGATVTPTTSEAQDFTSDVKYAIASYASSVIKDWWVHIDVLAEPSHSTEIEAFTFVEQTEVAVIDSDAKTISIEVEWDAVITDLTPTITISGGATINPASGVSQDFTNAFDYIVTAEDGTTTKTWTVTVTKQEVADVTFNVNMNKQINLGNFAVGTDVVNISGSFNSFGDDVCTDANTDGIYTYTAPNIVVGSAAEYKFKINSTSELDGAPNRSHTVVSGTNDTTVWFDNVELNNTAEIEAFTFVEQTGAAVINSDAKTISIEVEWDADITDLTPTITMSVGATVNPASGVSQDFTNAFDYIVTAENGTTTKTWTVTVTKEEVADVTFNVNMNKQINLGDFVVGTDVAYISGSFNSYGDDACTDVDADGIYTFTATNIIVGSAADYKFKINSTTELDGDPNRSYTVVSGTNETTVWFDNIELGTETTVSSLVYTVNDVDETIVDIPFGTDLATFEGNLTGANGAAFKLYLADETTVATDVQTGYVLIVTSEDESATKNYTITVIEEVLAQKLIITQYYEGASNNKWIEITNADNSEIDLSNYYLGRWSGTDTPTGEYLNGSQLSGTLAPGASKLYMNSSSALPTYSLSEGIATTACYFNGDDPVGLLFGSENWDDRIDCIYGSLTNGNWGTDISFVRKASIEEGNTDISDLTVDGEWITYTIDEVDNAAESTNERLGYHLFAADTESPVATYNPANNETDVLATIIPTIIFNELVYKPADGTDFTDGEDVSGMIEFYETLTPANTVSFTATISGKVISITPAADLTNSIQYTVTLAENSVADEAGNKNIASLSSFTIIDANTPVIGNISITETAPYYAGDDITVQWESANITNVKIDLWNPALSAWSELVASTDAASGLKLVSINSDATYSDSYKIRVANVDDASVKDSTDIFEVIGVANNLAALRARELNDIVKLTGDAVVTWAQSYRSQKYIQDGTGAILIDDASGIITANYVIGDQMTGLVGKVGEYGGMLQFVPQADPGAPTATGLTVTPKVIAISDFNADFEVYEAQLITFEALTFTTADGTLVFANGTAYEVSDGTNSANFRTTFYDVDYIGNVIPILSGNITGIANSRTDGNYISSRDASDLVFEAPSADATLSNLTVDGTTIADFDAATLEYTVELAYGTTIIPTVIGTATDANATAVNNQATGLPGDATIVVTAQDMSTEKIYTVHFTIAPSNDATLSDLTLNGTTIADFDAATFEYSVELAYGTANIPTVNGTATDANATVVNNQATELPGDATVVVTAEDGTTELTYTVHFTVTSNNDATLSDLSVDGTTVTDFNAATLIYVVALSAETTTVPTVTAIATDENATYVITDATEIPGVTKVVVTAEDESTSLTYEVRFTKEDLGTDATLSDLAVDGTTITNFDAATMVYTVSLPAETTDVPAVTATATDENATIVITDATQLPGVTMVVVTAEDESTLLTYEVRFTKENLGTDATLSDLTVDGTTVDGFDAATFEYTVELPYGTFIIPEVIGVATDAEANVVTTQASSLPGDAQVFVVAEDGVTELTYLIHFTIALNDDATLSDIAVDGTTITDFDAATMVYIVSLPAETTDVPVVTATATDENATIVITDATQLPGVTMVVVTAEDESTSLTYEVRFTKENLGTDATLSDLTVDGTTVDSFDAATLEYTVELPYGTFIIPEVIGVATDATANVVTTQASSLPGDAQVFVVAEDGVTELTYLIHFAIALNDDATLSDLAVDGTTIEGFDPATTTYVVPVVVTKAIPVITATTTDPNAVSEIIPATEIPGTTKVIVTAEDEVTKLTYEVRFVDASLSNDASLSDITIDGESIEGFNTTTIDYTVELPFGTTSIPVLAGIATNANATVVNNQASELPGDATVVVTAEDGATILTYTVHFTIAPNSDATLSDLTIDGKTVADFNTDTFEYTVELAYGTTSIPIVTGVVSDTNATVVNNQAIELPGDAAIVVTAEDESTVLTYTIHFTLAPQTNFTVTFNVTDENSSEVADASVSFNGSTVITDKSGVAVFTEVEPVTNAYFSVSGGGSYAPYSGTVTVIDQDVNIDVLLIFVGITENSQLVSNVYPNPTQGNIHIELNKSIEFATIIITDVNGKVIDNHELSQVENTIDLSGNKQGVYFITILSKNQIYQGKVILN